MAEGAAPVVIAVTLDTSFYIGALNFRSKVLSSSGMPEGGRND
jgi:hypothetical protein